MLAALLLELGWARALLRWAEGHLGPRTGLPALAVAAAALVVGYRVLRRSLRFAIEVAVVTAILLAATRLGWLRW